MYKAGRESSFPFTLNCLLREVDRPFCLIISDTGLDHVYQLSKLLYVGSEVFPFHLLPSHCQCSCEGSKGLISEFSQIQTGHRTKFAQIIANSLYRLCPAIILAQTPWAIITVSYPEAPSVLSEFFSTYN